MTSHDWLEAVKALATAGGVVGGMWASSKIIDALAGLVDKL